MPRRMEGRVSSAGLRRACASAAALAALVFHGEQLQAQVAAAPPAAAVSVPAASLPAANLPAAAASLSASSAAELAAGACRLGRWLAAIDLMRVVDRAERRAEDWLCLARAHWHSGQWVAALDSYDELAELEVSAPKERSAQQLGAVERLDLELRLAWITITPSSAVPASVELSLDGEVIAPSRMGTAFPVQPGTHAFSLEVGGVVRRLSHWRLKEGERRTVRLSLSELSAPSSEAPRARGAVAPRAVVRRLPKPSSDLALWGGRAMIAGGISAGVGFGVMASGAGKGAFVAGASAMLLGGVSLMTGATLRLIDARVPEPREKPVEAPRLQPWITTNAAGVSGSF
jgi:hypothetical protein